MTRESRESTGGYRRRRFLKYAGISATTAALAGCQGGGSQTPQGTDTPGQVNGSAAQFTKPFKLGMMTTKTGLGKTHYNSMRLAVDHINSGEGVHDHDTKGIGGADAEFVFGNTSGGPSGAKKAYRTLTRNKKVDATFGALSIKVLLPLIANAQKLHFSTAAADSFPAELVSKKVSPIGGDPKEEYEKYKYHFRSGPIAFPKLRESAVEVLKEHKKDKGWQNVSILIEQGDDSDQVVKSLKRGFEDEVGANVPVAKSVSGSLSNWSPVFDELENADTDLAFITLILGGTSFVNQWADQERSFEAGGIHIFSMLPDFWKETNGAVEGLFSMNAMTPQTTNTPYTQPFMKAYNERFGGYPLYAGPIAYDAIHHYKHAVEELGTRSEEKLIPYLEDDFSYEGSTIFPVAEFNGPNKRLAHDPTWKGTFEAGVPVYQQWQSDEGVDRPSVPGGGIMESFAPKQNKSADYVKPPWMR